MPPSAQFCRDQAAIQRQVSLDAILPSVRLIAAQAAIDWSREATIADRREARTVARGQAGPSVAALVSSRFGDDLLSENPDREHVDA